RDQLGQPVRPRLASQPRHPRTGRQRPLPTDACAAMNDVGEPCAGEPHARFERGPLARRASTAKRNTRTRRKTRVTGPARLPAHEQPAAYLTQSADRVDEAVLE